MPASTTPPTGVIGAALTPFTPDGTVNRARLDDLLDLLSGHCDAISVLGAEVTEYQVLGLRERQEILSGALDTVNKRVPVLAGVSHASATEVVRLAEHAASAGANFAQVLIPRHPGGNPASTTDLVTYFEQIAAASPLPIIAYHNPGQGTDADVATMVELSTIDGIVGFKESSRDLIKIGRLCAEIDEAGHARYYTTMQALLTTLTLGGSGAMMPPPGTIVGSRVVAAYRNGDHALAAQWQKHFRIFPALWSKYGLTTTMKAAMGALGYDVGAPAAPFQPMPEHDAARLARHLESLDLPAALPNPAAPDTVKGATT
ncbi:dihydrodipicolinate synthase family protein [Gordonia sp. DT219]|uniref:dihydrodipicolinate synthase family protein n=1 Tax=Gordonia sp. DT219 TaxID=3416658 RepID=UPI003CF696E3